MVSPDVQPGAALLELEGLLYDLRGLLWGVKILAETNDGDAENDRDAIARIADAGWSTAGLALALWSQAHAERKAP